MSDKLVFSGLGLNFTTDGLWAIVAATVIVGIVAVVIAYKRA